jgi:hypothetical protein
MLSKQGIWSFVRVGSANPLDIARKWAEAGYLVSKLRGTGAFIMTLKSSDHIGFYKYENGRVQYEELWNQYLHTAQSFYVCHKEDCKLKGINE